MELGCMLFCLILPAIEQYTTWRVNLGPGSSSLLPVLVAVHLGSG